MCGIAGMVGFSDRELLKKMCDTIKHRGPDDSGFFIDDSIGLGNRRLSIIDVAGGHQPIHNEDESVWIVFNGEIYNFQELRKGLEKKGHRFYTNTDTEVIVHAYEEFGNACVKKLRGMFAFAIWDAEDKKLLLARDRLGIKPLYYTLLGRKLMFASEIKSILQDERVKRKINKRALHYFLALRYVPGPDTMFQGIYKLQPGHSLTWKDGMINIKRYWKLRMKPSNKPERYYLKKLYEMLKESIRMRLMSEVPLGAYLSGGIDSTSVVALMSELMDEPVKTFSVGFGEERIDELPYSRLVADYFNTDHHEFIVEPTKLELLPKVVWYFDEPVADPAAIPVYLLSKLAKKYVTVVLTGEGGDELFAGYEHYMWMCNYKKYSRLIPLIFKGMVPRVVKFVPMSVYNKFWKFSSYLGNEGVRRLSEFVKLAESDMCDAYMKFVSIFDETELRRLLLQTRIHTMREMYSRYFAHAGTHNLLNTLILLETEVQLPDDLLMKNDKMGMAHSIETRVPFLDHELVEFAASLPQHLKLNGTKDKYILRKVMSKRTPEGIMDRKKHRFFVPIDTWFEGELGEVFVQLFSEESVKRLGLFDYRYITHILEGFKDSRLYYARQAFTLLSFEIWRRIFIEGMKPKKLTK